MARRDRSLRKEVEALRKLVEISGAERWLTFVVEPPTAAEIDAAISAYDGAKTKRQRDAAAREFISRYPVRGPEGQFFRVTQGDADLLMHPPEGLKRVVWEIVDPVVSPEDQAVIDAERRRAGGDETNSEPEPAPELETYHLRDGQPTSNDLSIQLDRPHNAARWKREFLDAKRRGAIRVSVLPTFLGPTRGRKK